MQSPSRKLAAIALVLLALVAVFLLQRSGSRDARATTDAAERPPASSSAPVLRESELAAPAELPEEPLRIAEDPRPRSAGDAPPCVVIGRAVDEHGLGLAGVPVQLYGWKAWADGHDVPRLPGKHDLRGWETQTGSHGTFRFEAPVPTVERTSLRITPDPFHDSAWAILGGDDTDARPPLHAGENDLGTFLLVATGAIRGTVFSDAGRPLAEASVRVANDPATTLERETESDARGGFLIGHVKPGTFGVAVDCEGYLSAFREPFLVEAGRITGDVEFVLRAAPSLRGRVVDEDGRGIEGAELQGWPLTSGRGAFGKSAADGAFALFLPKEEPYTLEVRREGYDSFGLDDRSTRYAPGTGDLRIVLRRSTNARTLFVVIDAESKARIPRFGLEIERDRGSAAERRGWTSYRADPEPVAHAGGEVEVAARPGLDRFTVRAPGYVRQSGDVRHVSAGDPRQVVELVSGGTLTGQVVDGGEPVAGAAVRLQPLHRRVHESSLVFRPDRHITFQAATDRAGRFRFDMLDEGDYQLVVRAAGGSCAERMPLAFPGSGNLDVGALALAPGATILGQVFVPPGRSAAGLEVYLQPWQHDVKRLTDAEGRFRFDGLLPGTHELVVDEAPGVMAGLATSVTLAAGEMREVVLDGRAHGTCDVTLTIELGDRAGAGLAVYLRFDPDERHELGTTDGDGRVTGWAPARGSVRVEVVLPGGARLVHPDPIGPLEIDVASEARVRFELGSLQLALPDALALPAAGWGSLVLTRTDDAAARTARRLVLPFDSAQADLVLEHRSIRCDHVLPGEYELTFALTDASAPTERIPQPGGYRIEKPTAYKASTRASVRANEVTRVELR